LKERPDGIEHHAMDAPNKPPISDAELTEIEANAVRAIADPKLAVHVPATTVLELVRGFRHFRDQTISAALSGVADGDMLDDVAERLDGTRDALTVIARGGTEAQLRALAKKALRRDESRDADMREEFGVGLEKLGRYVMPKLRRETEPEDGQHRCDPLGNVWALTLATSDDVEEDTFTLRLVEQSAEVGADDLMSATDRVPKRRRRTG
jgi:hypothetical protein